MPVNSKNLGQPIRSIHSPILSYLRALAAQTSTKLRTASVTSGHLGGLFGIQGIANFENIGLLRAFDTLPPTQIDIPSFSASLIGKAGHTV
jgi:hypothetical protein